MDYSLLVGIEKKSRPAKQLENSLVVKDEDEEMKNELSKT